MDRRFRQRKLPWHISSRYFRYLGDTDSASVGSYSGSLPPRLQANSRLNGATCQASLHLSATHMAATNRKPSRQLPLPATNKSSKFPPVW